MTWTYSQATGNLSHDGESIAIGYAGKGAALNDPASQDKPFAGPLPRGSYTVGAPMPDGGHMGPFVLPLAPWPGNNMCGRCGFYIHGDTPSREHSASNGCIVLDRQWRTMIAESGDTLLVVTA
jgi:hypothetical protein